MQRNKTKSGYGVVKSFQPNKVLDKSIVCLGDIEEENSMCES